MATNEARSAFKMRKQLVEPVFGIIKEQQGLRRFLLRGVGNVAAEWTCWQPPLTCGLCGVYGVTRRPDHPYRQR